MYQITKIIIILFIIPLLGSCATTSSKSTPDKRQEVLAMKNEVLSDLYKIKPHTKSMMAKAPGYTVFSHPRPLLVLHLHLADSPDLVVGPFLIVSVRRFPHDERQSPLVHQCQFVPDYHESPVQ